MDVIYWILISISFILSFIALIWPVLPGTLFLLLGYIFYGLFFSFEPLNLPFWIIQITLIILLLVTDYLSNLLGIKKLGGNKAAIWGSTIGLIVGPFIIPVAGILIGPFIGAVIAEIVVDKKTLGSAVKVGVGSLLGFIGGTFVKMILQIIMIAYFFIKVL